MTTARLEADLIRTWLFVAGAEADAHNAALASDADAIIQDLEDFTPPARRMQARSLAAALSTRCRAQGVISAIRINQPDADGLSDLAAVINADLMAILLPKVATPDQIVELDHAVAAAERTHTMAVGQIALVPNIETAAGLVRTGEIARASPRVIASLVAAEDMAADLGAERSPEGSELSYVRSRFLVECRAVGVEAIDCPYTFANASGAERAARQARRLGYRCKSLVRAEHAAPINRALTPQEDDVRRARHLIASFDAARQRGADRALIDTAWVELPTYLTAQRLVARAERLMERPRVVMAPLSG